MEDMLASVVFVEFVIILVMLIYINYLRALIKDCERVEREVEKVLKEREKEVTD